jgi:hypothetical protein
MLPGGNGQARQKIPPGNGKGGLIPGGEQREREAAVEAIMSGAQGHIIKPFLRMAFLINVAANSGKQKGRGAGLAPLPG